MTNIIKFSDAGKVPAHLKAFAPETVEDWGSGQVSGFPVLSIKGKVFHIIRGDEKELIARPDDPDEAATSVHLVILKTHKGVARTFYEDPYEEGSNEAPDCFSNDGVAPDPSAENPQAKKCAVCPHSQWGSRVTDNGKKGKACSELKRLAVAEPGNEDDPMLLRVPPTSLKNWDDYLRKLGKKGITPPMVVTKVGFDASVAHQLLTFKPVGFLDEESAARVAEMQENDVVEAIIGHGPAVPVQEPVEEDDDEPPKERKRAGRSQAAAEEPEDEDEDEEPAPRKKARQAAAEEPEDDDDGEDEPAPRRRRRRVAEEPAPKSRRAAKTDEDEEPAPRKKARQPDPDEDEDEEKPAKKSAKVVESDDDLEAELDGMLGELDFDD